MFYSAYDSLLAAGSRYSAMSACPLPVPPLPLAKLWSPWLPDPRKLAGHGAARSALCYMPC